MTAPPQVLTRAECGLAPPDRSRLTSRGTDKPVGVTVHCTVTATDDPVGTWRQIQAEYLSGQNVNHQRYGDIPYDDGITLDGRILSGREHKWVGAHALSSQNIANRFTLGVAIIGTGATITPAAEWALRCYLYYAALGFGHAPMLFDHLDWRSLGGISTACPDPPTVAFVNVLKAELRANA